jgi:hypothetical protein
MGISHGLVQNLLKEEIANRLDPLKDQYLQYELDRLDHMQQAVIGVLEHPGQVVHVAEWRGEYELNAEGERFRKIEMVPVLLVDDRRSSERWTDSSGSASPGASCAGWTRRSRSRPTFRSPRRPRKTWRSKS